MIAWMLYSALVALIVAAAARAAEWLARLAGYRVRWVWAGALALTVFLSASAVVRGTESVALETAGAPAINLNAAARVHASGWWRGALSARLDNVRRTLDAPVLGAVAAVRRTVSPTVNMYAASLSSLISLGLVLVLAGVGRRFRNARRDWPLVTMQGVSVRVAPRIGPVVIGLVRPDIVVPRWLLARHADEQRLVVTHEDEHVRARDPLLLGVAWAAVVAAPWNPAVWYMLSRLRLAVELDCDARVLRRGAAPRSYGSLLIDVAQHASGLRLSALALADDSSHLHQRILAMKPSVPRFARLRGGFAAMFALTGILVACQATLPTDADIERMNVADVTRAARELAQARHADTAIAYTVDGAPATSSDVSTLPASALGKVEVVTGPPGNPTRVNIETRKATSAMAAGDSGAPKRTPFVRDGFGGQLGALVAPVPLSSTTKISQPALIFIDGVRATMSDVKALDRSQIESVEILKGAAAAQEFGDPEAAKGVITVKTKRGAK